MTVITEIEDIEICTNCGHICHCSTLVCESCEQDDYEEDSCRNCRHG